MQTDIITLELTDNFFSHLTSNLSNFFSSIFLHNNNVSKRVVTTI